MLLSVSDSDRRSLVAIEYLDLHGVPERSSPHYRRVGGVSWQSRVVVLVSYLALHVRLHQI